MYIYYIEQGLEIFSIKDQKVQQSKFENKLISIILELLLIKYVCWPVREKNGIVKVKTFIIQGIKKEVVFPKWEPLNFSDFIMVGYLLQ